MTFLIFLSIFSWAIANTGSQVETKIYVDPTIGTANPGETFSVNIKIANVEGLYDYEFRLKWEPDLLDVTSITEGPFLNAEDTYSTFFVAKEDFPSVGHLYVVCTLMGEPRTAAASGSGTLATVEFLVEKKGFTSLRLYGTLLEDYDRNKMPHTTEDGYFQHPFPEISINPSSIVDPSLGPGNTFNVNIVITQAEKLYSWSLNMSWDPAILNVTEIEEGPFLNQEDTYNTTFNTQIHQEEGYLYANCTLEPLDISASGDGTLAILTFFVKTGGTTVLHFYDTRLLNYDSLPFHGVKDGYFGYILRDVALVNVGVSPNKVKAGDSVSITVIAKNEGTMTENFDVAIYYNASFLGRLGISNLDPNAERTLTFSWSTKGLVEGKYGIKAVASEVPEEIDINNNAFIYEYLIITPPEQSFPFVPIIAVTGVLILVVFAGLILVKRRR